MHAVLWQVQNTAADDSEATSIIVIMIGLSLLIFLFGGKKR